MEAASRRWSIEVVGNPRADELGRAPPLYHLALPLCPPESAADAGYPASLRLELWCEAEDEAAAPHDGYVFRLRPHPDTAPGPLRAYLEARQRIALPVAVFLAQLYAFLEDRWFPGAARSAPRIRDYAYAPADPLHFGHHPELPGLPAANYAARVIYPFRSAGQGEMSVEVDEAITVLKNLGNGWVTARKAPDQVGLLPENYIQRLP